LQLDGYGDAPIDTGSESIDLGDTSVVDEYLNSINLDGLGDTGDAPFQFDNDGIMTFSVDFHSETHSPELGSPVVSVTNEHLESTPLNKRMEIIATDCETADSVTMGGQISQERIAVSDILRSPQYDEATVLSTGELSEMAAEYLNNMHTAKRRRAMRKQRSTLSFLVFASRIMNLPFSALFMNGNLYFSSSPPTLQFGRDHFRRSMSIEIARRGLSQDPLGSRGSQETGRTNEMIHGPLVPSVYVGSSLTLSPTDTPSKKRWRADSRLSWNHGQVGGNHYPIDDLGDYHYGFDDQFNVLADNGEDEVDTMRESERAALSLLVSIPRNGFLNDIFPAYEYTRSAISRIFLQLLWLANENRIILRQGSHGIMLSRSI
jgi:hypothetical protein